ncbi:MAG: MBL fold metallo-hydrolase [Gemmatimonadetes bacterium]|nr:MBL fold metallo-hydrolase [Gemmatimonadota bacterium]
MTAASPLEIRTFTSAGFGENAYLAVCRTTNVAVAVDPGAEAPALADALVALGAALEAILLTHAHVDHIEGVGALARRVRAPVYLHPDDRPLYDRAADQAATFGYRVEAPPAPDHELLDGQLVRFGECMLEVRHCPGHSPGHVILYSAAAGAAFVGDVVFMGSIGRTDLPGGDHRRLLRSIREQVLSLPAETTLYPGHGPATTVGHERVSNPFLVPLYGGGLA